MAEFRENASKVSRSYPECGVALVQARCSVCHSLARVERARYAATG